jgi:NAD(P)-dependent dehydrogenase (short-subunit alcohol dehydrogenase family)
MSFVREVKDWCYEPGEMFNVKGKVVFVTGAASGLGQAIALGFDALGSNVVLSDIDQEGLELTASKMNSDPLIVNMSEGGTLC